MSHLSALQKLERTWEKSFSSTIAARGVSYSTQGRVIACTLVQATPAKITLSGTIRGTRRYSATVTLALHNGSFELKTDCSCPYSYGCKHAAALIHTFFKGDWEGQLEHLATSPRMAHEEIKHEQAIKPLSASLERALDQIHSRPLSPPRLPAPTTEDPVYTIGYLFTPTGPISPGKLVSLKASLIAVPKNTARFWDIELCAETVQQLIALGNVTLEPGEFDLGMQIGALSLTTDRPLYSRELPAAHPRGEEILRAVKTGRAYCARHHTPLRIGPERVAGPAWQVSESGKITPILEGLPDSAVILTYESPYLYYDFRESEIGVITPGPQPPTHSTDLLAWLRLSSVKKEQALSLVHFLETRKLPLRGLDQFTATRDGLETCTPRPHIIIRPTGIDVPCYSFMNGSTTPEVIQTDSSRFPLLCAELHFMYGDIEISHTSSSTLLTDPANPAKRYLRDTSFERAAKERLRDMNLTSLNSVPGAHSLPTKGLFGVHAFSPADSFTAWMYTAKTLSSLERDSGWKVTFPPGIPLLAQEAAEWFGSFEAEESSHWFEGELGIIVDGQKRDLTPLLLTLIRDRPHYLTMLKASQADQVIIQDKNLLVTLDRERLVQIIGTLTEFSDHKHPDGTLRLSLYSAQHLEQALAESVAQWTTPAALTDLKRRIRLLTDIPPQKAARGFNGTLREYQAAGVNWLCALSKATLGGILADDMGLGKTIQLISFLLHERTQRHNKPSIVVCPKSIAPNWAAELSRFAPKLKIYRATGADRAKSSESLPEFDILLTTYPLLARDAALLSSIDFNVAIFDEAQYIKNPLTLAYQAALKLRVRLRLPVSGTPIENNLDELWSHFNMALPGYLGTRTDFRKHYRKPIEKENDDRARELLAARIKPFIMRRLKKEVAKDLPPVTEIMHRCELESGQRDLYETIRKLTDQRIRDALSKKGAARSHIEFLDALLKLRQVCCDPRLVKSTAARKVKESAKLASLSELLGILMGDNLSVIIFSQFTSMLTLIEDEVKKQSIPYTVLTGKTDDRETPLSAFQSKQVPLLLMSLKAGGVGLNLCTADAVILYDPWWNPAVEEQAISRAHRIGRTQPVLVYRLIADKTIEEKILDLHARKKSLATHLLPQNGDVPQLTEELVDYLFAP